MRIQLYDGGGTVVRFVGAVSACEICHSRASPFLMFLLREGITLGWQQAGDGLLSACNNELFARSTAASMSAAFFLNSSTGKTGKGEGLFWRMATQGGSRFAPLLGYSRSSLRD